MAMLVPKQDGKYNEKHAPRRALVLDKPNWRGVCAKRWARQLLDGRGIG
jgi:hypothetical protein